MAPFLGIVFPFRDTPLKSCSVLETIGSDHHRTSPLPLTVRPVSLISFTSPAIGGLFWISLSFSLYHKKASVGAKHLLKSFGNYTGDLGIGYLIFLCLGGLGQLLGVNMIGLISTIDADWYTETAFLSWTRPMGLRQTSEQPRPVLDIRDLGGREKVFGS